MMLNKKTNKKTKEFAEKKAKVTKFFLGIAAAVVFLTIFVLATPDVLAIEVPMGIDGTVYHLDGITEVPAGVILLTIKNIDTGEKLVMTTGRGTPGRYSAVLPWQKGSNIQVIAANPEHNSTRNTTLEGVIHGFDLTLNMTLSQRPPVITSTPVTTAAQDSLYEYVVYAFDWNGDNITYYLEQAPQGMTISSQTGKITWVPGNNDVGIHTVIVKAADEEGFDAQEYVLNVIDVNDPPKFTSIPPDSVKFKKQYLYEVQVEDPEGDSVNISLESGPQGMLLGVVAENTISWTPQKEDVGDHVVRINAVDSFGAGSIQEYTLTVTTATAKPPTGGRGGFGGAPVQEGDELGINLKKRNENDKGGSQDENARYKFKTYWSKGTKEFSFSNPASAVMSWKVYENNIRSEVAISDYSLEQQTTRPDRFVYKYLQLHFPENLQNLEFDFVFKVSRDWADRRNIASENIILMQYVDDKWEEVKTALEGKTEEYYVYTASANSPDLIAISHKVDPAVKLPDAKTIELEKPFTFYGRIILNGRSLKNTKGIEISALSTSNKGEKAYSADIISFPDGSKGYQLTVYGDAGDDVKIYLDPEKTVLIEEKELQGSLIESDIRLFKPFGIGGFVVLEGSFPQLMESVGTFAIIAVALIVAVGFFVNLHFNKFNKFRKEKKENKK